MLHSPSKHRHVILQRPVLRARGGRVQAPPRTARRALPPTQHCSHLVSPPAWASSNFAPCSFYSNLRLAMVAVNGDTRKRLVLAYRSSPNFASVGRQFNVDPRTVKRWVRRQDHTGGLKVSEGAGRNSAMSESTSRVAVDLLLSGKHDNVRQVALELRQRGLTDRVVHVTTLSRHAKAQALADGCPIIAKRGKPVKALSAKNRAARLSFCEAHKRTNWGSIMITDRKKFLYAYPGCSVKQVEWLRKGEARVANRPNKPSAVNMYAGITKHGVTKAHLVTGTSNLKTAYKNTKGQPSKNITSAEYADVLRKSLLPEGRRLFSFVGLSNWVFQQDNDPAHKRAAPEAIRAWNSKGRGRVQLLQNWPPNSPDLTQSRTHGRSYRRRSTPPAVKPSPNSSQLC